MSREPSVNREAEGNQYSAQPRRTKNHAVSYVFFTFGVAWSEFLLSPLLPKFMKGILTIKGLTKNYNNNETTNISATPSSGLITKLQCFLILFLLLFVCFRFGLFQDPTWSCSTNYPPIHLVRALPYPTFINTSDHQKPANHQRIAKCDNQQL